MSVSKNYGSKSVSKGGKAGSVPLETGIRKHLNAAMFRILSRSLKQRSSRSISDNVHSMAQRGEKRYLSVRMNKENWARPCRFLIKLRTSPNSNSSFVALLSDVCIRKPSCKTGAIKLQSFA